MARIYVAGHRGMVGGVNLRRIEALCSDTLITRSSTELYLTNQVAERDFIQAGKPEALVLASTKPDCIPRKLTNVSRLAQLGRSATRPLEQAIEKTYRWYPDQPISALRYK